MFAASPSNKSAIYQLIIPVFSASGSAFVSYQMTTQTPVGFPILVATAILAKTLGIMPAVVCASIGGALYLEFCVPDPEMVLSWKACVFYLCLVLVVLLGLTDRHGEQIGAVAPALPAPNRDQADWDLQDLTGWHLGRAFLADDSMPPLSLLVARMIERGHYSGLEAGFLAVIEKAARSNTSSRSGPA